MAIPTFFTSAAGGVHDREMVLQFHEDLSMAVKRVLGGDSTGELGMLLSEGGLWEEELLEICRTTKVLVAMVSPDFVKANWCLLEWAIFRDRVERAARHDGKRPRSIMHVRWSRGLRREDLPIPLKAIQWPEWTLTRNRALVAKYREMGLAFLMRNDEAAYREMCDELAFVVAKAASFELPPMAPGDEEGVEERVGLVPQTPRPSAPEPRARPVIPPKPTSDVDPAAQLLAQVTALEARTEWSALILRIADLRGAYLPYINPTKCLAERCRELVDLLRISYGEQRAYSLVHAGLESIDGAGPVADAIAAVIDDL